MYFAIDVLKDNPDMNAVIYCFLEIRQELRTLFSICQRSLDFPSNTVQLTAYLCLIDGTTYLVMDK